MKRALDLTPIPAPPRPPNVPGQRPLGLQLVCQKCGFRFCMSAEALLRADRKGIEPCPRCRRKKGKAETG